jgi:hypothetical protein
MEEKYQEIYKQLKSEAKLALEQSGTDKFIDEFKSIVKTRLNEIHQKLDIQRDKIVSMAIEVYNKEVEKIKEGEDSTNVEVKVEEKKKTEEPEEKSNAGIDTDKKSVPKKEEPKKVVVEEDLSPEALDNKLFKDRIKGLIGNLQDILNKTESLEETVSVFKNNKLNQLLDIKDNDFIFKHEKKLKYRLSGKVAFGLGWSTSQNKPTNSDIDPIDSSVLNVHGNSCYNYYTTDKPINDESVVVILESDIYKTDGYLYFGITTSTQNFNSYCMCCTCQGVTYIKSNGYIVHSSQSIANSNLKFDSPGTLLLEIKIYGKEKQCYFKVNDFDEQGPYPLPGDGDWIVTSGSCNQTNGKIRILSSQIIG